MPVQVRLYEDQVQIDDGAGWRPANDLERAALADAQLPEDNSLHGAAGESRRPSEATAAPHCCFIGDEEQGAAKPVGCAEPAAYQIIDLEDTDPYQCATEACAAHIGALIGHAGDGNWTEGMPERWEVVPIAAARPAGMP